MPCEASSIKDDYDYFIKLLAIGNSGVGKTSLLYRYTEGTFTENFVATVGIDFQIKHLTHYSINKDGLLSNRRRIQLQLWDTAGQERFRSLSKALLRDAMGFFVVFDLTNIASFRDVCNWLSLLRGHAYCETPDIILVGNKYDLEKKRVVPYEEAESFAKGYGFSYLETSAVTGRNINEAVDCLLDAIMLRIERSVELPITNTRQKTEVILLSKDQSKDKSCFC